MLEYFCGRGDEMEKRYQIENLSQGSTLAERLKYAMALRDKTAAELHRGTGISESILSRYISGVVEPKRDNIYLISKFLNVNEMWLMGLTDNFTREYRSSPTKRDKINNYLKELSDADLDALIIVIENMFSHKLPL